MPELRLPDLDTFYIASSRTYYDKYCKYVHKGQWLPANHTRILCERLEMVEDGAIKRLMVFMPPRHSKSMTVTETFPSWFIGKNPERRVIEVSYGDSLAQRFGKYNRQKVSEYGKAIFDLEISPDKSSMTDWDIKGHRGGMISVGIGGSITGQGADLLLIDDPIKNREEANSEVYRQKVWDEWQNTLYTRLHPGGAVIIILTRWHEDDLAGRLLNPEYGIVEDWDIVSLPALAEANDPMGREPGEALWPERYGIEALEGIKNTVGSHTWTALYQQHPTPLEGGMIKRGWWKYYKELPGKFDEVIQSWDMAFKDTAKSDFVVGQVWGRIGAEKYLLDQVRARMDFPTTVQAVKNLSAKWPQSLYRLVEDKANGTAVIATLNRELGGMVAENPEGSKEARMAAISASIEAGNVYIPDPSIAPWINDFIEELSAFPNGRHDDQADCLSQALKRLNRFVNAPGIKSNELDTLAQKFPPWTPEYQVHKQMLSAQGKITDNEASLDDLGL